MTVTTKQIETIKFQIEFMVMMQNCGRLEEAQESMLKISTLLEQLIGVEVVHWLRRDLFEELNYAELNYANDCSSRAITDDLIARKWKAHYESGNDCSSRAIAKKAPS